MDRKQLEAIVHEEVTAFTESFLNENPAVIAIITNGYTEC